MGLPSSEDVRASNEKERARLDSFFTNEAVDSGSTISGPTTGSSVTQKSVVPPRPSRESRRQSTSTSVSAPFSRFPTPTDNRRTDFVSLIGDEQPSR
jgi:hypothetical protein